MSEIERARTALNHLDSGCSRDEWIKIGMAAKSAGLSFEDFNTWSASAPNYDNEKSCKRTWDSFSEAGGRTAATLYQAAYSRGWKDPNFSFFNQPAINKKMKAETNTLVTQPINESVIRVWEACSLATADHPYILRKQGKPDGLRVYPATAPLLIIRNQNVAGYLVVPCWSDGQLQTFQFIPPNTGTKLNIKGASFNDGFFTVGEIDDKIYICEGIGQAWSASQSTGAAAVVSFGSGRMKTVARILHDKFPNARLIIIADYGQEKLAAEIAEALGAEWVEMPSESPSSYDANDYLVEFGEDALRDLLVCPLACPVVEMPLSVIFADELSVDFTPPDELVEGVLIAGDGSILYGDSNSGKTFFVIDLACAIARGVDWFGRKTEPGLVIYLAVESPASVRRRLQAYQKHHNVRVQNFAVVQSPIDLFDGESDTDKLIQVVRLLEKRCGQKARLIVGDTLARLSAGANENAGQDMGLVVRHFDRIRNETEAHFMLIHHSGKNAAAGARGWSGVRAAVDTEIEVVDSPAGRCAEITKQRDLGTKGTRIGFCLQIVSLGLTKWESPATSCVVVSADAPPKSVGKRLSEIGGAIAEFLRANGKPIMKRELVRYFESRYTKGAVYRQIKTLVETGVASDCMGFVTALDQSDKSNVAEVPIGAN